MIKNQSKITGKYDNFWIVRENLFGLLKVYLILDMFNNVCSTKIAFSPMVDSLQKVIKKGYRN